MSLKKKFLSMSLAVSLVLLLVATAYAGVFKYIRTGSYQFKVLDSGGQSEAAGAFSMWLYDYDNFDEGLYSVMGYYLGTDEWTNPDGVTESVKISNAAHGKHNETWVTMPVPDEDGVTIHRYMRYAPPTITVDGLRLDDQFPRTGDEVAPEKIPGTADVMIESWIRTSMGITIHQRVFAWSQEHNDDYAIWDWTFTNTGNIDLDDEVELPDQTLQDVYFMRSTRPGPGWRGRRFFSAYGQRPGEPDSLRMVYSYPARTEGADYDNVGRPDQVTGYMEDPIWKGEAILHVDQSVDDETDDIYQPQMTAFGNPERAWQKFSEPDINMQQKEKLYTVMQLGSKPHAGTPYLQDMGVPTFPNTHHSVPMEDLGYQFTADLGFGGRCISWYASGPYQMDPGESFRIVWADVAGSLSPQKAWEIGNAWANGNAAATWEESGWRLSPQQIEYPDLAPTDNDKAKDSWVYTVQDTLFRNAANAQWNANHDYNIPVPPAPPSSIEVTSKPDRIEVVWGASEDQGDDVAGYKLYRARGDNNPTLSESEQRLIGVWEEIADLEADGSSEYTFDDDEAQRGQAYYYYVTTYDDGQGNIGAYNQDRGVLESGKYLTRIVRPAHLTRPPEDDLSGVRVVPNPFNVSASDIQFTGEPNKIIFMNLPPECTIDIYTESGDLVQTLEHIDGSGDEPWGQKFEEHLVSRDGQVVVSGLYFAHITTPDGQETYVKFVIIR
ncbi:MAG TPA: hypothetical protein VKA68_03615 [bacterium]|nr:hypothetical protein [bacterium]